MYVSFEITALFPRRIWPYRRVKNRGNFKLNILTDSIELFLYCLGSKQDKIVLNSLSRKECLKNTL